MPSIGRVWPSDDDDGSEVGDCGDKDCDDDDDEVDQWFSKVDIYQQSQLFVANLRFAISSFVNLRK